MDPHDEAGKPWAGKRASVAGLAAGYVHPLGALDGRASRGFALTAHISYHYRYFIPGLETGYFAFFEKDIFLL